MTTERTVDKKIKVDVLCDDSENPHMHDLPIWNDAQVNALEDSGLFKINNITKIVTADAVRKMRWENKYQGYTFPKPESSDAEVIISSAIDQQAKALSWNIFAEYKYKVFVADEPIYNPDARLDIQQQVVKREHEKFINILKPDLILYSCKRDCLLSPADSLLWTNLIDYVTQDIEPISVVAGQGFPHHQKKIAGILAFTNETAGSWLGRLASIDAIRRITHNLDIDMEEYNRDGICRQNYMELCKTVRSAALQFLPTHGCWFHNLRFLQSWFMGSIPIVVNKNGWLLDPLLNELYGDFIQKHNYTTCVLTDPANLEDDLKKCVLDHQYLNYMLHNVATLDLTEHSWKHVMLQLYHKIAGDLYD